MIRYSLRHCSRIRQECGPDPGRARLMTPPRTHHSPLTTHDLPLATHDSPVPTMTRRELVFPIMAGLVLMAVAAVPYALGYSLNMPSSQFHHNLKFDYDFGAYYSFIRQ